MKSDTLAIRSAKRLLLASAFLGVLEASNPAFARPPQSREPDGSVVERVGNFLFKTTRKLERSMEPTSQRVMRTTTTVAPRSESWQTQYAERPSMSSRATQSRVWDPVRQEWVSPEEAPRQGVYYGGGSAVTVPSQQPHLPSVRLQARPNGSSPVITDAEVYAARQMDGTTQYLEPVAPQYGSGPSSSAATNENITSSPAARTSAQSQPQSQMQSQAAPKPDVPQAPAQYGTRVPGKPGFVYPPGLAHESVNMLDVRDLPAGQKVRDPRSGLIFLVP